jgi:hypothetical protein
LPSDHSVTLLIDLDFGLHFVNRYKKYLPIAALVLIALGGGFEKLGIDLQKYLDGSSSGQTTQNQEATPQSHQKWSSTNPEINLWHIFEGEINRSGKPVGYHSRPGGIDAPNARIVSMKDGPNRLGVYTATIEIRDGNQWKSKFSSFFPDSMSSAEVVDAVLTAYKNSDNPKKQPWQGPSGLGFNIQGYTTSRGGINTAFPVYRR